MNNNLTATLKKFSLPVIILLLGIVILVIGNKYEQPKSFMIASGLIVLAGAVMTLFSAGLNLAKIALIIGVPLGIASIYIYYDLADDVISIHQAEIFDKELDELIKQNLNDLKSTQIAYKEYYGTYAKNFDDLRKFIVEGKIKLAVKNGGVPNRRLTPEERAIIYGANDKRALDYNMTEIEAITLAKSSNPPADLKGFVRDTVLTSFFESSFGSEAYKNRRAKMGFPEFNVDSLFYVPTTGNKFLMIVTDSIEVNGIKVQGLYVEGKRLLKKDKTEAVYSFGSTVSSALSSNWD